MTTESVRPELHRVSGASLLRTVRSIVRQGNVRRVVIKNRAGRTLLDVPLTVGVVGAALAPFWAAVGGIAALTAQYTIEVERVPGTDLTRPGAGAGQ